MKTMKNNTVKLTGNVGAEGVEFKIVENVTTPFATAKLRLATNETYKNSEGKEVSETEWHNIEATGKVAEFAKPFVKGSRIIIEGSLKTLSWEKDGKKFYKTIIKATSIKDGKKE